MEKFDNVSVVCKANVYFGGKVVSHTVIFKDGTRKTLGLIFPGSFSFNTEAPEKMEITSGACQIRLKDEENWTAFDAGSEFMVPGDSSFEINVDSGVAEYICSYC